MKDEAPFLRDMLQIANREKLGLQQELRQLRVNALAGNDINYMADLIRLKPLIDRIANFEADHGSLFTLDLEHAQEVGLMVRAWTGTNSMRAIRDRIEHL